MTQSEYNIGIVRGLENYQKVLRIISKEDGRLPKLKYYQRSGIVAFTPEKKIDISSLMRQLEERGLVLKVFRGTD